MFFATSHGKEPCDGIGGTVKRLVSNAGLQCISDSIILNPHDMFKYCKKNFQGIKFIFITKELPKTRESLEDRFAKAITIPGTKSYHEFIPFNENTIAMKYCSKHQEVATTFSFLNEDKVSDTLNSNEKPSENFKALDFVSCYYDNYWWIGLILEKDDHQEDSHIKFMHPSGPSPSLVWPSFEDICWLPNNPILCKIDSLTTKTGRSYVVSEADITNILSKID